MPYAVTHVLVVLILLELFRDYFVKNKKAFPAHYLFIGAIASLSPDLDFIVYYILYSFNPQIEIHRIFTHNIFIPLIFLGLAGISYKFKSKELGERHLKLRNIFLVIAFSIFIHLILDVIIAGSIIPFYPFSEYLIGLNLIGLFPLKLQNSILASVDAALLILWLIHLECKHKISSVF